MMQHYVIICTRPTHILFRFRTKRSLLLFLNAARLAEKQHIPILYRDHRGRDRMVVGFISWWRVLLVEDTRGPEENHRPAASQ
jgi:hypothetical protein